MSNHSLNISVNIGVAASGLRCADFLCSDRSSNLSPIDDYYLKSKSILIDAGRPSINPLVCSVLGVGIIASAEFYIREILVGLVNICPIVQKRCEAEEIKIGAFQYYGSRGIGFSLADSISFSNSATIADKIKLLAGIKVPDSGDLAVALLEFARLCNIRHSIVHACGLLSHHHLKGSDISSESHPTFVSFDFSGIQTVLSVCHNLVRTLNSILFDKVISDWIDNGIICGQWSLDSDKFSKLIKLFDSREDRGKTVNPYTQWLKIRKTLIARNR